MGREKRKDTSAEDQLLHDLERELSAVMALGLVHSENAEANLARVSPRQRNELVARVESHQRITTSSNVPVGGQRPERGLRPDEIPGSKNGNT